MPCAGCRGGRRQELSTGADDGVETGLDPSAAFVVAQTFATDGKLGIGNEVSSQSPAQLRFDKGAIVGSLLEVRNREKGRNAVESFQGLDAVAIVYYVVHMNFGQYVRDVRERRRREDRSFSVRQVAQRIGVEPAYLSKIERDQVAPPSEATIRRLAVEFGEDPDLLLAMAGKVSSDLQEIILRRPRLFAELLRQLKNQPDHAILRVVREIRDGHW